MTERDLTSGDANRGSKKSIWYVEPLADWDQRLYSIADRVSVAIERYWYILALCFSIGYFSDTLSRAARKMFWFDEIFTVYLSRLPDFKSLWHVLMVGVDLNPPLLYIFTKFSNGLFGESQVSTRIPEIIGFWIFCLCLFRFVWKRSSALSGFLSMLFPMVTLAYWYADEARPYGIELGFCGVALACWQVAADRDSGRLGWLLGFGAALAGGLFSHGYGFLIFFPLIVGEMARTIERGRADWAIWSTMAISSTAALVSIPQAIALKAIVVPGTVLPASLALLVADCIAYLKPSAYVVIGWLGLMCLERPKTATPSSELARRPRLYETLALFAFLAIPVVQYLAAKLTAGPLIARYTICWVAGPACLFGFASARRPLASLGTLGLLVGQLGLNALKFTSNSIVIEPSGYPISTSLPAFRERYQWMYQPDNQKLPIAVLNSLDYLPFAFYGPPDVVPRLTYVMLSRPDRTGVFLDHLRSCCVGTLRQPVYFADFLASHDAFLAYAGPLQMPQLNDFIKSGASVTIQNVSGDQFLVCVRGKQSTSDEK